jgi:hypothetical protein
LLDALTTGLTAKTERLDGITAAMRTISSLAEMEKLDASIFNKIQRRTLWKEPSESTQIPSRNAMLGVLASPETVRRGLLTAKRASLRSYKHDEDRQDGGHQKDPSAAMSFDWRHERRLRIFASRPNRSP